MNIRFKLLPILLVVACYMSGQTVVAAAEPETTNQDCVSIISDLERLACFDKVHTTPGYLPPESVAVVEIKSKPRLVRTAYELESQRLETTEGFLVGASGSQDNTTIRLSTPGWNNYIYEPVMLLSCVDNITRLQIILNQPIDKNIFPVVITDNNGLSTRYKWQVSDDGYVIDAGRGLYSIKIINSFFNRKYLDIDLTKALIGKVQFDIRGLSESIKTLRKTCHW